MSIDVSEPAPTDYPITRAASYRPVQTSVAPLPEVA